MKRFFSILISLTMAFGAFSLCGTASANDYAQSLRNGGFSESYIDSLVQLHSKHPNWEFKAFKTGLDWSAAVAGERSQHKNQIIEKSSSYGDRYYCNCSKCKVNGNYVYQYSGCYSASQWAVEYFMDPRNWLDEQHIFQFHSNGYSKSETQAGVEAILKPTWMHNANITYKDTNGSTVTYKTKSGTTLKYSKSILLAAQNSGLSAYYIASRIVKEVGSTKPSATGVCGTKLPFAGMYNYYSIGATSGGTSGLEFASGYLRTETKTTLFSAYDSKKKQGSGTKTALAAKQYMSYIGTYGDYYKVRLYSQSGYTSGAVGYVLKSALRTTYFNYGRPWTNPHKSISGGAKYIANSYLEYQNTGYLEKFNVNSASGMIHSHEYMQNVDAVSIEAVSAYKAYKEAGLLNSKHTFYIPVFNNMPGDTSGGAATQSQRNSSVPTNLKLTFRTTGSIRIKWNAVSGAAKYYVAVKNLTAGNAFGKTVTTPYARVNGLTAGNKYRFTVRAYKNGKWSEYSKAVNIKALPMKVKYKVAKAKKGRKIYTSWKKVKGVDGYQISYAKDVKFRKKVAQKRVNSKTFDYTGKNFTKGATYYVRIRAYKKSGSKTYYGKWSAVRAVKCR